MVSSLTLLAQGQENSGGTVIAIVYLAILILLIVGAWKMFVKAGEPGWASIIPIYNLIVLLRIAGKPWWWIILYIIPIVNIVVGIIVNLELAKNFGKGVGFALGLIFLPFIFFLILGFGDAQYRKPAGMN